MHTHYKGTGKVHSFRGLLLNGGQTRIRIQGSVGAIAWRITKFQIFANLPGTADMESTLMIWREEQATVSEDQAQVDFENDELLGVAFWGGGSGADQTGQPTIIFDNALFVRNIYVTHTDTAGDRQFNYYIELEEVTVSAAGMAQLAVAAARNRSHLGD